jgi:hypothetical protein
MACGAGKPGWSADGLLAEGAVRSLALNNTFSMGSGNAFTSWSLYAPDAGAAITQDVGDYIIDATGFRRSMRISAGTAPSLGTTAYQSVSLSANSRFRAVLTYRNDSSVGVLRILLRRTGDGYTYRFSTGTWVATDEWFALPQTAGALGKWASSVISLGSGSGCTIHFGTGLTANASVHVHHASLLVVPGAETTATPIEPRSLIVTTTAAVSRVPEVISVPSNTGSRRWRPERGTAAFVGTPNWSHAELGDGEERCVLSATLGGSDRDRFLYRRISSTAGKWIFSRRTGGAGNDVEVTVSGADLPMRLSRVRLGARWTSVEGELGTARLAQLFVHQAGGGGILSASLQIAAVSSLDATETLYLGGTGGTARADVWDGAIELVDVVPRVLYDEELKRRMGL